MDKRVCIEVDGIFYESITLATKQLKCGKLKLKERCLSDEFPNWKIVPFRITYTKKTCMKCGKVKLLKEFPVDKRNKDDFSTKCKRCHKVYMAKWYQENLEYSQKQHKEWYKNNLEHAKEYKRQPKIKAKKNKKAKEKRETNIDYKINTTMRNAINHSLKGMKNGAHWEGLAGYTCSELRAHLESLFTDGMSWDNYGHGKYKWNLDHIIAIYHWNITSNTCQEFKDCWALRNLQPLWAVRNYEKNNKPMEPKYLIKPF